ncbi:hypothetical protein [Ascidiimonas aurantiaca]|uniref:hypothetical protein n=1 Tax=Ascidiimonas aurantiaca TaxID=1685432 RepID=UPI0030EE0C02
MTALSKYVVHLVFGLLLTLGVVSSLEHENAGVNASIDSNVIPCSQLKNKSMHTKDAKPFSVNCEQWRYHA